MILVWLQKCENSVAQDLDSTAGHTTHSGRVLWNCGNQEGFPAHFVWIVPSNAHILIPFFQKTVFFSNIFFGNPPSKFLEVFLNSEYLWKWSPVYNFNSARALKKLLSAGVEVTSTLPNWHTEGFTNVNAFIQLCLTSTLFCEINKTGTYHIKAFEYPLNFFWVVAFLPGKISSEKRCRS